MTGPSEARPTALIGFAESVSGPEVAFSLLDAGFEIVAFARADASPSLRKCEPVRLVEITPPRVDAAAAASDLERVVEATRPDVILPLDDGAVWLCDRLGANASSRLVGPSGAQVRLALDKRVQMQAAERAGFEVLPTLAVESALDLLESVDEFPVVIKPALAVEERARRIESGPVSLCAGHAELQTAVQSYRPDQCVIAQPFVVGHVEGLFGLACGGELVISSAHRRVRSISAKGSTSACIPVPVDRDLDAAARRMLSEAGWSGLFMVELLRDRLGTHWFMELNGRAWGSMALARKMGFEYPAWAALQKVDQSFTPAPPPPRDAVMCRHLGREILHVLGVLRGPDSAAPKAAPSRGRAVRQVLRVGRNDRWYNLRPGYRPLFVSDTIQTVRSGLTSKLRSGADRRRLVVAARDGSNFIRFRRRGLDVGELYFEDRMPARLPRVDYLRILAVLEPTSRREWKRRDTLVVCLKEDRDVLFSQMTKSTRYEVKRAENRDGLVVEVFERPSADVLRAFADYYDEFARSKQLPPIFRPRLDSMAQSGMLVLSSVSREGMSPLAWHAYARSSNRAVLIYSASLFRDSGDSSERNATGRANRYLHWSDMLWFKDAGYTQYDLGGVDAAERDPATARIAAFKQGFGGDLRATYTCSTALSPKGHVAKALLRLTRVDF